MMQGLDDLLAGIDRIGVRWMLGGSVGAMCYSEPRATLDVDCIVELRPGMAPAVITAFPESSFYVPPEPVIAHEIRPGIIQHHPPPDRLQGRLLSLRPG